MYKNYMDCIAEAGGVPVILPLTEDEESIKEISERFDAFLSLRLRYLCVLHQNFPSLLPSCKFD